MPYKPSFASMYPPQVPTTNTTNRTNMVNDAPAYQPFSILGVGNHVNYYSTVIVGNHILHGDDRRNDQEAPPLRDPAPAPAPEPQAAPAAPPRPRAAPAAPPRPRAPAPEPRVAPPAPPRPQARAPEPQADPAVPVGDRVARFFEDNQVVRNDDLNLEAFEMAQQDVEDIVSIIRLSHLWENRGLSERLNRTYVNVFGFIVQFAHGGNQCLPSRIDNRTTKVQYEITIQEGERVGKVNLISHDRNVFTAAIPPFQVGDLLILRSVLKKGIKNNREIFVADGQSSYRHYREDDPAIHEAVDILYSRDYEYNNI